MTLRPAVLAAILCISACSAPPPDVPPPPPRPTTAPAVPVAGDLQAYVDRACELLAADQAAALGLPSTGDQTHSADRGLCVWEGNLRLGLQVRPTGDPLGDTYRRSSTWEVFTPLTVANQPAVRTTTTQPGTGCRLVVGTAPDQGLELDLSTKTPNADLCNQLEHIAETMITRLRG
ncbi:DUF3558 family protein [Actinokineospora sp. NPDC004072]